MIIRGGENSHAGARSVRLDRTPRVQIETCTTRSAIRRLGSRA
jgi:hypothetical protein